MPPHARLHVVTLSSFAIAQPLYDLIGRNPEFLVAHGAGPWTVAVLVAAISLGIPLSLVSIAAAIGLVSPRLGRWITIATIGALAALVAAGALRRIAPPLALSAMALTAVAVPIAYHHLAAVRTFLTVSSIAIAIFPLIFIFATPVSRIVRPRQPAPALAGALERRPPILVVVFDELGTFSLLNDNGELDAERFPNFAALARRTTWFPNAVAAFPYTEQALPAILTGLNTDRSERRLMLAEEYPNNLFSWLGTSYALHVAEPISGLCPRTLCTTTRQTDARGLISDLAVLYLHLVVPHRLAEARLPSLAFTWKGFAGEPAPGGALDTNRGQLPADGFNKARHAGRDRLFRRFIEELEPGPVLHFAHVLLPHDPYVYLASGHRYSRGGVAIGLSSRDVWIDEPVLIATGRRQHLAQVQFVDALLGELVARLDSQGLFDPALIIITSDHGSAFVAGEPHRDLTAANYREVVATPMFVKLPYQREGHIDVRRASALDIVPTIADVLRTSVPWRTDGRSILARGVPDRDTLTYAGSGVGPLPAFDVRAEARAMQRNAATTHLEDRQLIDTRLPDHDIEASAARMQVLSDSFLTLQSVPQDRSFVPVLIAGRIEHAQPEDAPVRLAIAVNGVVQAVTRTAPAYGAAHYFAAIVPESAVQAGANVLDVLAIEGTGSGVRLARISSGLSNGLEIARGPEGTMLVSRDGRRMALSPHVIGTIERIDEHDTGLDIHGWGVDRGGARELRAIVAFGGNSCLTFAYPSEPRADVAATLRLPASTRVSYVINIARQDVAGRSLRLFGISADGKAGELHVSNDARHVLSRLWETSRERN